MVAIGCVCVFKHLLYVCHMVVMRLCVFPSYLVPTTTFSPVVECFTSDFSCSSVQPNSTDAPTNVAMLQAENHGTLIAAGVLGAILLIALVAIVIVCVLFVCSCASLKKMKGTYNTSDQSVGECQSVMVRV